MWPCTRLDATGLVPFGEVIVGMHAHRGDARHGRPCTIAVGNTDAAMSTATRWPCRSSVTGSLRRDPVCAGTRRENVLLH